MAWGSIRHDPGLTACNRPIRLAKSIEATAPNRKTAAPRPHLRPPMINKLQRNHIQAVHVGATTSELTRPSDTSRSSSEHAGLRAPSYPSSLAATSPQLPVAPSPISSDVGTEFTDIDGVVTDEDDPDLTAKKRASILQTLQEQSQEADPVSAVNRLALRVNTSPAPNSNYRDEIEPQSVIHVPQGFGNFDIPVAKSPPPPLRPATSASEYRSESMGQMDSAGSVKSDSTVTVRPADVEEAAEKPVIDVQMPPTPLQTQLPMTQDWSSTPRAQTRSDLGAFSRPGSSLASILEGDDVHEYTTDETAEESEASRAAGYFRSAEDEIDALRNALAECWTLCNTLASLSYIHRERIFNFSGRGDMQQQAWKSCWKLCQNLYDTQEGRINTSARPTLDLCRDFCAALFDVRVRDNETADSVLRVSFELNNHLFNTHDRSLPEAFRERTLDFYITLCHRLMKQKARMAQETDSLLKACWSLAEMLFSLRQNKREGKKADEELLGSAVQACWELCDLFREGWTQIRPERGTPRPVQTTFTQAFNQAKRAGFAPLDENGNPRPFPETPTTIFEDTVNMISPDDPPPQPNILVLANEAVGNPISVSSTPVASQRDSDPRQTGENEQGKRVSQGPMSAHAPQRRSWSAASSIRSASIASVTESAAHPVSSHSGASAQTVTAMGEDPVLTLLKTMFVKAAVNTNRGFSSTSSDPSLNSLPSFVRNLPDTAFGPQVWQVSLLDNYRKTIQTDPTFRQLGVAGNLAERGRVNAVEVARAVKGMTSCVYGFGWLRDLYRYVFGFYVEEALKGDEGPRKKGSSKRSKSSTVTLDDATATVDTLRRTIQAETSLTSYSVKYGYPPKQLVALDQVPGATLLSQLDVKLDGEQLLVTLPPLSLTRNKATTSSIENDPPEIPVPELGGFLTLRVMPDDNSCLFRAISSTVMSDVDAVTELRAIVAETIQADRSGTYTKAVLDNKEPSEYCRWIQSANSWGGQVELVILAKYFGVEIFAIDVQHLRVDRGIHYDAIALNVGGGGSSAAGAAAGGLPEADVKQFDPEIKELVMGAALELCERLQERHYYTDTAGFKIRCNDCGARVVGEKGATEHATRTGHYNFGEGE
ncbi:hypothetical protein DV738_g1971, partial [Chaetothyriales sp. CBS 135597]